MTLAFTFPGQGSQKVGMGKELAESYPEARAVFDEVDEALGQKLSDIAWNGPEDELTRTANAQPALMTVSLATLKVLESRGVNLETSVKFVAGHSLGEYSALAALGCISLSDTARLLRTRGDAMQEAVSEGKGGMAALLGLDIPVSEQVAVQAAEGEICEVANDNASGQVVLSGNKSAILRAVEIAKEKGAKRAIMLPVSAPFHCSLMAPAEMVMRDALEKVEMNDAKIPLICNVDAEPVQSVDKIRNALVRQVTGTVKWRESVLLMKKSGVSKLVEIGAGKVLTGLVRRISDDLEGISINSPEDVKQFLN